MVKFKFYDPKEFSDFLVLVTYNLLALHTVSILRMFLLFALGVKFVGDDETENILLCLSECEGVCVIDLLSE